MSALTPTDATRILRAWEKANAEANNDPEQGEPDTQPKRRPS